MIQWLSDHPFELKTAGKKAAHLHQLFHVGCPVPNGFVIHFHENLDSILDIELETWVQQLGGWPVAVRSSGILEDLGSASFAGQYQSFLNIADVNSLRHSIQECRSSANSPQITAYLKKNNFEKRDARVSVLVQRMVRAQKAGVGFTIHPLTGREDHALVEVCLGLGEKLVSGQIEPSSYVLNLRDQKIESATLGSEKAELTIQEAQTLSSYFLTIQAYFGRPQDIEWAIDSDGSVWILQSRPITQIQWRTDVDEYTNADLKDGGVSARVCTPLMFSLYRDATQHSMQRYFESIRLLPKNSQQKNWMDYFYGRVYWNASVVKRCLYQIPGFDEERFDHDIGIQKDYGVQGPRKVPNQLKTLVPAIPVAIALEHTFQKQIQTVKEFSKEFPKIRTYWIERSRFWSKMDLPEFFSDLVQVIEKFHLHTEETYFTTVYNNSNAQTEFKSFLEKMDQTLGGETALVYLLGGLVDVAHMEMQKGLLKLYQIAKNQGFQSQKWLNELHEFLNHHGFHSDAELDLTVPRWSEIPQRIQEMIEGMIRSSALPSDPAQAVQIQKNQFEEELQRVESRFDSSLWNRLRFRNSFYKHLKRVRTYLSIREQMREYSTQCYALVRLCILEAGKRFTQIGAIPNADDIFMLQANEIVSLAQVRAHNTQYSKAIQFRKAIYQGYRNLVPPNELGKGVCQRTEESYFQEQADGQKILKGTGCSPGIKEGTVRVVETLSDMHQIQEGDILVTRFTDPSWTPVLGLVSGIVTEVGGLLSHAAVIGREYGIPAVLNLPTATRSLQSGQKVKINGLKGTVEILCE